MRKSSLIISGVLISYLIVIWIVAILLADNWLIYSPDLFILILMFTFPIFISSLAILYTIVQLIAKPHRFNIFMILNALIGFNTIDIWIRMIFFKREVDLSLNMLITASILIFVCWYIDFLISFIKSKKITTKSENNTM